MAFDFDPPGGEWKEVFPLAKALQGLLEELKLIGILKTSGKRGLHVLVPLARGHTHEQAHTFAQQVTDVLAQGAEKARGIAKRTMTEVYAAMGLTLASQKVEG